MDPATIALAVAGLLARKAADELAGEVGKNTWAGIKRVYALVSERFAGDERAEAALREMQLRPNDEAQIQVVAREIRSRAESDQSFHRSLEELVSQAEQQPGFADVVTLIQGNARVGKIGVFRDVKGDVKF